MIGQGSNQPAVTRRSFGVTTVCLLAVLALALMPVSAMGAASDQYTEEPPSASGGNEPQGSGSITAPPSTGQDASAATDGSSGGAAPSGGSGQSSSSGGTGGGSTAPIAPNAGTGDADAPASSPVGGADADAGGKSSAPGDRGSDTEPDEIAQGSTAASSSDDDNSSSALPILIGILVLVALSVGAVLLRNRRQTAGAS